MMFVSFELSSSVGLQELDLNPKKLDLPPYRVNKLKNMATLHLKKVKVYPMSVESDQTPANQLLVIVTAIKIMNPLMTHGHKQNIFRSHC